MYRLIGGPRSRAFRVVWALEEIGAPYEVLPVRAGSKEARELSPSGKVPALEVDGTTLTDSVAIIQFLADRHGQLTHLAGSLERGIQDGFTQFAVDEIDGPIWTAAKHRFALPEELRVPEVKETARAEFARGLATLAARFGDGPFIMGEMFTVPDLIIGHCAGWARAAKFALPETEPLAGYFERVRSRPALARALASVGEEG